MPRASRIPVGKEVSNELKENFASLISSLSSSSEIEQFFHDFLTKEENTMLMKRLMIHLMFENGYRNSDIRALLGVSKETVRHHRDIWQRGGENYKKTISKIAKKEKTREFFRKLENIFKPLSLAMKAQGDMKARAKFATGDWFDKA